MICPTMNFSSPYNFVQTASSYTTILWGAAGISQGTMTSGYENPSEIQRQRSFDVKAYASDFQACETLII